MKKESLCSQILERLDSIQGKIEIVIECLTRKRLKNG